MAQAIPGSVLLAGVAELVGMAVQFLLVDATQVVWLQARVSLLEHLSEEEETGERRDERGDNQETISDRGLSGLSSEWRGSLG